MSAHDSINPTNGKKKHVQVDATGVSMSWRNIVIALTILLGGGTGYTGLQLVTKDELDTTIQTELAGVNSEVKKNRVEIVGITATIGLVDKRQIRQMASEEAREETADIENRQKREREYERIYDAKVDQLMAESERAMARAKREASK